MRAIDQNSFSQNRKFLPELQISSVQLRMDQCVESLSTQVSDWRQMLAMSVGSATFQSLQFGFKALGLGHVFSGGFALCGEAAAFGSVNRALHAQNNGVHFFEEWRRDVAHFGLLKGFASVFHSQNYFLNHASQALGMVTGSDLTALLRWTPREDGDFSQRFVDALAMSVTLEVGNHLGSYLSGHVIDRGLQGLRMSAARSGFSSSSHELNANAVFSAEETGSNRSVVQDVTGLHAIPVQEVRRPTSVEELQELIRSHDGPLSIAGGRYSMGGQIACENALVIDMKGLNKVVDFRPEEKTIRVQAGITWREILDVIDPHDLSIQVMQSYTNFTVGGSLSVNAHGRYMGEGPVVSSVKSIRVALADGKIVFASPEVNPEMFFGCIGGYGALGVVVEATLSLAENRSMERVARRIRIQDYPDYFRREVASDPASVLHNADILPHSNEVLSVTWRETRRHPTLTERLIARDRQYTMEPALIRLVSDVPGMARIRGVLEGRLVVGSSAVWERAPIVRRNYEASHDVRELEPIGGKDFAYVLQEYFVPEAGFASFAPRLNEILRRYSVNVVNVSIRHAKADHHTLLSWAPKDAFCFVLYYKQGVTEVEKNRVGLWTRELIDAAIVEGGTYYLPYQLQATREQFRRAYPRSAELWALKQKLDPRNKFRNSLIDAYRETGEEPAAALPRDSSVFRRVYQDAQARDQFFLFLQNIYRLYPEHKFHSLIRELVVSGRGDREIYEALQARLPAIRPPLADITHALPSLVKQKQVMSDQVAGILAQSGVRRVDGYLEIGSKGRYVRSLRERVRMEGPLYLINEEEMGFSAVDVLERGQWGHLEAASLSLDNYRGFGERDIPSASLDLVSCFIGLHHAPETRLDEFVRSIHRVLKPGGRFLVRDHDVNSPAMRDLVNLVHDVFNAGIDIPWEATAKELRNFRSVPDWIQYLEARGFRYTGRSALQDHDPSRNTLLEFVKLSPREANEPVEEPEPARLDHSQRIELPETYRRREENTFLTFPEWYIVYMSQEYTRHLEAGRPPSEFPYFDSIRHFWRAYAAIIKATQGRYPFNYPEHLCEGILGASISAEFGARALYEGTIGRATEKRGGFATPEDRFARDWNARYAGFIPSYQFYLYNYLAELSSLNRDLPPLEMDMRRLERRAILNAELAFKVGYGKIVDRAFFAMFGRDGREIFARGEAPDELFTHQARLRRVGMDAEGETIVGIPRYQEFTDLLPGLLEGGLRLRDIAGNQKILVSVIVPRGQAIQTSEGVEQVFSLDVLMDPLHQRVGLFVDVRELHSLLPKLRSQGIRLEHVYEY